MPVGHNYCQLLIFQNGQYTQAGVKCVSYVHLCIVNYCSALFQ